MDDRDYRGPHRRPPYEGRPGSGYSPTNGNGRMYDERRDSRPSSRNRRRRSSSRTPLHDISRMPPRGPAANRNYPSSDQDWNTHRDRDRDWDRDWDRDYPINRDDDYLRRGRSRSPRRASRGGYRDRDREGCRSPRHDSRSRKQLSCFTNTGDSDVSPDGTSLQFLLFRGLEPGVNEELLAKGVVKLYKSRSISPNGPTNLPKPGAKIISTTANTNLGAKEGSLKRILLVKDRRTDESWRYGFAEFASVEDAQAALQKYNSLEKFTISSKPVLVSYIHTGVFVPKADGHFTFSPLHNPSLKLAYWDEKAYVSELVMEMDNPEQAAEGNDEAKEKTAKSSATTENEAGTKSLKDTEGKAKKRKAEAAPVASNKKVVPAHLQFWHNRHAELHGVASKEDASETMETTTPSKQPPTKAKVAKESDNSPPTESFADLNRKCCLLCLRQFKTEAEVNKHERLSQLHRDNLKNPELRAKALAKLSKTASSSSSPAGSGPQYRDRAKERRSAFNQPSRPAPDTSARPTKEPEPEDPTPVPSKGATLLNKMGWTAGEGLGAQGTGMTAPIPTEMYVQGVGLGAAGGKLGDAVEEASRRTKGGYSEFLERTKDKAKERFEGMG